MNIGVHDGILDKKHVDSIMKCPAALYLWCLRHQTKPNGLVLGGAPITYERINARLGQNRRTLERWMKILRDQGYIEVTHLNYKHMRIRVLKSKKFSFRQLPLAMEETDKSVGYSTRQPSDTNVVSSGQPYDKSVGKVTTNLSDTHDTNVVFKQSGIRSRENLKKKQKQDAPANGEAIAISPAAAAAFDALGYKEPFGEPRFQNIWAEEWPSVKDPHDFIDAMERAAKKCQADHIRVPSLFFTLKREVEKQETRARFRVTPL